MTHRPRTRRQVQAAIAAVAAVLIVVASSVQATAEAETAANAGSGGPPTGPLTQEMADMLELQPGGIQISDNAMAWNDGDTIMVWPDQGESSAPAGFGPNVRHQVVAELGIQELAIGLRGVALAGSVLTCPGGPFSTDYYCFYTGSYFDGARLQFSSTCSGSAASWGFDNATSSWVNRDTDKIVYAYDRSGGALLWTMSPNRSSSYVGSADDNRMGYWRCVSA